MSLYIPTDYGLLGTHVTWEDVETALQAALGTTSRFGAYKKVTNIAEMKGFLSRIALVEPDWARSNIEGEELPAMLVVKIASQLALVEIAQLTGNKTLEKEKIPMMLPVTKSLHNREVGVYKMLEEAGDKVPHAKMYFSKSFEEDDDLKAFFIFSYIPNHHIPLYQCLPADKLITVIRAVASFSALGEKLPEHQLSFAGGTEFWNQVLKEFQDAEGNARTAAVIRAAFPDENKEVCEEMLKISDTYYTKSSVLQRFATCAEFLNHKPVLGHCDLWNSNLLFKENLELAAIIDFQTVSWCSPGLDLSRLFACVLSKTERREQWESLLEEYYNTFLKELDGKKAPYTLEQLRDSYSIFFPIMGMIIIPGIAGLLAHDKTIDQKQIDESMDKLVGLMEDVIAFHNSNLQKFPTFYE